MRAIFRNFIHVIRRFKIATTLNIVGLSAALVVFTICAIQTHYELTFNGSLKNSGRLYQLALYQNTNYGKAIDYTMFYRYSEIIKDNQPMFGESNIVRTISLTDSDIKSIRDGEEIETEVAVTSVEPQFLDIIGLDIIEGDGYSALADINQVIISKKTAERLYGNNSPIGEYLTMYMPMTKEYESGGIDLFWEEVPMVISAVYKDFPNNTSFNNGIFTRLIPERYELFSKDGNNSTMLSMFRTYYLMEDGVDKESLEKVLTDKNLLDILNIKRPHLEDIEGAVGEGEVEVFDKGLELIDLHNIHINHPDAIKHKAQSRGSVLSLIAIGIVTLAMGYINFVNFITAMAPMRIRSINTQKIFGAGRVSLALSIVIETLLIILFSFAIALIVIHYISTSSYASFFTANLSIWSNLEFIAKLTAMIVIVTILIALYPSYHLTSFSPITTYGGATIGHKGSQMRGVLTSLQFVAATVLILIAFFIKIQHNYFKSHNMGMNKESILVVKNHDSSYTPILNNTYPYIQEASTISGIANSTAGNFTFTSEGMVGREITVEGKQIVFSEIRGAKNFFEFFEINVNEGREIFADDNRPRIVAVNQTMMNKYGREVIEDEYIANMNPVVVEDFNFTSLYKDISELRIILYDDPKFKKIYFRLDSEDIDQTIRQLNTTWDKFTNAPFEYHFLDEVIDTQYKKENDLASLLTIFATIAILIAIMGVYGMITFNSRYRAKEIAIRKVQGSTNEQIIMLLNKGLLTQFVIAFTIATPIAYYAINRWLEQFPYRTPIHWWVFVVGASILLLITILTVSVQSHRAATANPIGALKDE